MQLRWISLLAVSLMFVSALPTAPASGAAFSVRVAYEGTAVLAHASAADDCGGLAVRKLGVVCATLPARAHVMDFFVEDTSKMNVGGTYYLYDAAGNYAGSGTHCNGENVPVAGAALAIVRLEALNGPIVCASEGKTAQSLATKGFVSFVFS